MTPLIAIEGGDGAGTTTQTRRLAEWLAATGRAVHATREPSTGPIGQLLRRVLAGEHAPVDAAAVALLFAADRLDHLAREVEPARAAGQIVLTDRYRLSSLVYQSLSVERALVVEINRRAPPADLTLLVDVPVEVAAARRRARGGADELFDDAATQARVRAGYLAEAERARAAGERLVVVDGTPDPDTVFAALQTAVQALLREGND
jgi:dTMP kinase